MKLYTVGEDCPHVGDRDTFSLLYPHGGPPGPVDGGDRCFLLFSIVSICPSDPASLISRALSRHRVNLPEPGNRLRKVVRPGKGSFR